MATRNVTMVVDRSAAEDNDLGFACNPSVVSDKSYVNMYLHHDGYPEYIIWTGKPDVWISCYDQYSSRNVFVLPSYAVIQKYKGEYEYTDFNHKLNTNAIG